MNFTYGKPFIEIVIELNRFAYNYQIPNLGTVTVHFGPSTWKIKISIASDYDIRQCRIEDIRVTGKKHGYFEAFDNLAKKKFKKMLKKTIEDTLDDPSSNWLYTWETYLCWTLLAKEGLNLDDGTLDDDTVIGVDGVPEEDGDRVYYVMDEDPDKDYVGSLFDNCPEVNNPGQEDIDGDEVGDACDTTLALRVTKLEKEDASWTQIYPTYGVFTSHQNTARLWLDTRGGYGQPGNRTIENGQVYYCACDDLGAHQWRTPEQCRTGEHSLCPHNGSEWTDEDYHGWYPISWSTSSSAHVDCGVDIDTYNGIYCPPIPGVVYQAEEDSPDDHLSEHADDFLIRWHWLEEALPPHGELGRERELSTRERLYLWSVPRAPEGQPDLTDFHNFYSDLYSMYHWLEDRTPSPERPITAEKIYDPIFPGIYDDIVEIGWEKLGDIHDPLPFVVRVDAERGTKVWEEVFNYAADEEGTFDAREMAASVIEYGQDRPLLLFGGIHSGGAMSDEV